MGGPELYVCEEMPPTGIYSLSVGKRRRSTVKLGGRAAPINQMELKALRTALIGSGKVS